MPVYAATLLDELGIGKNDDPKKKLLAMRNQLAHSGRVSEEMTHAFLKAHTQRFEDLILGLDFLSEDHDVKLVASPADGEAIWLRGLPDTWESFNRAHLPEGFQQCEPDRMLLVKPKEALDLFPLHAYGEVFQIEKSHLVGKGEDAIHIFARREKPTGVGYTVLGSRETHSRGKQAWEDRFADIFKIEAWQYHQQTKSALTKYAFIRRMDDLLELFIGRDEQVATAARRIEATASGILWLGGKPGMGKSAFMAKLVRDAFQHETETTLIIPYFFQLSDGEMCRIASFLEAAILRLTRATEQTIRPKDDPQERRVQFKTLLNDFAKPGGKKLVFFVDGLDEIAGVDPTFIDLIFECQHPGVVWVCTGRDKEMLRERFSRTTSHSTPVVEQSETPGVAEPVAPEQHTRRPADNRGVAPTPVVERSETPGVADAQTSTHTRYPIGQPGCVGWFFECDSEDEALRVTRPEDEGLLPPLTAENVRGFLIEQLGHQLKVLFERDQQHPDGSWSNAFLEELVRRSEGLPLYLRYLVQDIQNGKIRFAPGSEKQLPVGLMAYYDQMIDEMGNVLTATTPGVIALLALAKEPLPFGTLAVLLADHELVGQAQGQTFLMDALRYSSSKLQREPNAQGVLGYTLYHGSLQGRLLQSPNFAPFLPPARKRLCKLAVNWRDYEPGSPPRDYALRFGPAHLIEEGKWDEVEPLLTDLRFIEAKCAVGMTYELIADYTAALDGLPDPDAQAERRIKQEREARVQKYIHDLIAYAKGEIKELEIIESVEPWSEERINGDSERIKNNPTRLDRMQAFAQFIIGESHLLVKFAPHYPGFCIQHTYNSANSGPVAHVAERLVTDIQHILLLNTPALRPEYNPHPGLLKTLGGHTGSVRSVSVTPDGRRAISGSADRTVRVWDLERGVCLRTLKGHIGCVNSVCVTPDGRCAVSGSNGWRVRVWDLERGICLRTLKGHTRDVNSVCVTPDGRCAVSRSEGLFPLFSGDYTVRVWDLAQGGCLHTLTGHTSYVESVSVTPDGRRAVSGGVDRTVRVWDLDTGACLAVVHTVADVTALSTISAQGRVVCGCNNREILLFRCQNLILAPPVVTSVRLWLFGEGQVPGQWDMAITTVCQWCGQRFPVAVKLLDVITGITRNANLAYDQSPCLDLPAAAWDEPKLLSECPLCRQPLKFNPFVVDNRGRSD